MQFKLGQIKTCRGADEGKVGDDLLGVLSLSGTRLTSDCWCLTISINSLNIAKRLTKNGLVLDFEAHGVVGALSDGKDTGEERCGIFQEVYRY